jgi:hypothetical protein
MNGEIPQLCGVSDGPFANRLAFYDFEMAFTSIEHLYIIHVKRQAGQERQLEKYDFENWSVAFGQIFRILNSIRNRTKKQQRALSTLKWRATDSG